MPDIFKNRKLLIATKHKKETVIAKHFETAIECTCEVIPDYDTDMLGTFTGEVERNLSPLETVKQKCLLAMDTYGYDLGIANEGSFGPHPGVGFIPCDEEYMILMDKKWNLEIVVKNLSTETNFSGHFIHDEVALKSFVEKIDFPSHGVILRKDRDSNLDIIKDCDTFNDLKYHFQLLMGKYGKVFIETDMRAMKNPTRMLVIEQTALKLLEAIQSTCPLCNTPGFMPINYIPGLPCSLCTLPTKSILAKVFKCNHCGHEIEKKYPNQKREEDPQFCDYCNP